MSLKFKKSGLWLILIVLISLLLRLWRLETPSKTYFDEIYHIPAAQLIANNDPRAYEWWHQPILGGRYHDWLHPPLVKLIQGSSIKFLGSRPLAWRLPSVLAGTGLIAAVYFLGQQVFKQFYSPRKTDKLSLLAAFLTAASGLVLVQSRIGMNDIFLCLWLVLSLIFLYRWRPGLLQFQFTGSQKRSPANLVLAGLFLGLALATKWSALFLIIFLFFKLCWMIAEHKTWRFLPITIFSFLVLPAVIYISSYSQMFFQGKDLSHFAGLHRQIIWYQFNRSEGHEYASTPAEWFINFRPVKYWGDDSAETSTRFFKKWQFEDSSLAANIYALGNPLLQIIGPLAVLYLLGTIIQDRLESDQTKLYLSLLTLYGILWLPWLAAPRVMFYYHYLPAVPLLSLVTSSFLESHVKPLSRLGYWLMIGLILIGFVVFYPHWTGITVPKNWAEAVYFGLQSWR